MPSKRRKYNARFPAGRIKKIMQTDEQVGKVAQAVPIIISRTLELFVQSLLNSAMMVTNAKNARTLSPSHMKQCIISDSRFNFLKDLVRSLPDVNSYEEDGPSPAPLVVPVQNETLSQFSGRKFTPAGRRLSQGAQPEAPKRPHDDDDSDSEDSEESESDKEAILHLDEGNSEFVIDEDYGT